MAELLMIWNRERDIEEYAKSEFEKKIVDINAGQIKVMPADCVAKLCDICAATLKISDDESSIDIGSK
jgi:hypothetical protein